MGRFGLEGAGIAAPAMTEQFRFGHEHGLIILAAVA